MRGHKKKPNGQKAGQAATKGNFFILEVLEIWDVWDLKQKKKKKKTVPVPS